MTWITKIRRWVQLRTLSFCVTLLALIGGGDALAQDLDGPHTFEGVDSVQPTKVSPSGTGQEVLVGLLRARWAPNTGNFAFFQPSIDAAFTRMNSFWDEATFGRANFTKTYLGSSIIGLPNSNDYYYHAFQQRDILGAGVAPSINLATDKTLVIKSDGQEISVTFAAGNWSRASIKSEVDAAITNANQSMPAPTFAFDVPGDGFRIRTTKPQPFPARLEVAGDALPYLGFGTAALYDLGDTAPPRIIFGRSIADTVNFPAAQQLIVTTQGVPTTVNFAAGNLALADVVAAIRAAYPGAAQQQPFSVEEVDDPLDAGRGLLVFKSNVDVGWDHGFRLTVGGPAAATLGFYGAGVLLRNEPETFRGFSAILHGFNAYARSLPAGTDLKAVFGDARMFVGILVNNANLRAHYQSRSFVIGGSTFEVSSFVSPQNHMWLGEVFSHETGHALGLPDLYSKPGWIGVPPSRWDVMDCSSCDAHSVAYLKSRHHVGPSDRTGQWVDEPRIARVTPPPGAGTRTDRFILTPVESPWISNNPFAGRHPGVPVVHAVELVPTDDTDVFVIENRQVGTYTADHLGPQVDFSTHLPARGVIVYNGRRPPSATGLPEFLPVNLVTTPWDPLDVVGETFEHVITNLNRIQVRVVEALTNPAPASSNRSFSYLIEVRWGEGSFYDVAIRPWQPPPYDPRTSGWTMPSRTAGASTPITTPPELRSRTETMPPSTR
jgi:hypothetical protein